MMRKKELTCHTFSKIFLIEDNYAVTKIVDSTNKSQNYTAEATSGMRHGC